MGLRGIVVKSHASADRLAFAAALARADAEVQHGLNERIAEAIGRIHVGAAPAESAEAAA